MFQVIALIFHGDVRGFVLMLLLALTAIGATAILAVRLIFRALAKKRSGNVQ